MEISGRAGGQAWLCSRRLAYVEFGAVSNADIRAVFELADKNKVKASRIIKETVNMGLIKPLDPETAPRYMRYIPAWAV